MTQGEMAGGPDGRIIPQADECTIFPMMGGFDLDVERPGAQGAPKEGAGNVAEIIASIALQVKSD